MTATISRPTASTEQTRSGSWAASALSAWRRLADRPPASAWSSRSLIAVVPLGLVATRS